LEVANSLINIAAVQVDKGDHQEAMVSARRAVEMLESLGSKVILSEACAVLAQAHLAVGELDAALHYGERALSVARETGSHRDDGVAHRVLGQVCAARAAREGDAHLVAASKEHFEQALEALRKAGDFFELAKGWRGYALFLADQGEAEESARCAAEAECILQVIKGAGTTV